MNFTQPCKIKWNDTWITSFLTNRIQSVVRSKQYNFVIHICNFWCAYGTIFGPVLFLIFINDLPTNVKNSLFTDDCILHKSIQTHNDCVRLQEDLYALEHWEKMWLMKFNPFKCCVMTISLATKYKVFHNYVLYGTPLPVVNQFKYLGVTLQHNLYWDTHVSTVTSKARRFFWEGILRQLHKILENWLTLHRLSMRPLPGHRGYFMTSLN